MIGCSSVVHVCLQAVHTTGVTAWGFVWTDDSLLQQQQQQQQKKHAKDREVESKSQVTGQLGALLYAQSQQIVPSKSNSHGWSQNTQSADVSLGAAM
jgi:hypothetical protein